MIVATLRMPLHAEPERPFWIFDGLDGAIGRASGGLEAGMGHHRLVVVTADLHTITDERSHPGAFASGDRGPAERVAAWCVLLMSHNIGEVLFEQAAGADRHHLHAATNAERRKSNPISRIQQPELPRVTITTHLGHLMGHLAIALRIHIGATRDDQPVEPGDHLSHALDLWWQQHHHTARSLNRSRVDRRQQVGRHVPYRPGGLLAVGAEADHRPALRRPHRRHGPHSHILSKLRLSSQSVTAASNASSSTSAMVV